MPPPISDLLRSRGGQTRTNNNNNDVLPLHNNNHNNNNNNNGTSVGRTASNVSTNNFLLGGMYVPNKDKRRQPKRRRVMGHNNNNNIWVKCSLESIRQNVYIRYIFMIFMLVMFGMIISQQQKLEEEDFFAHQRNTYRNQHRTNHQTNNIDRLLQDTKLIHQLPSMQEEKKRLARRTEDRYKYQQQRQQKHFKLLEMLVPEWYHRNDPIRIIESTTNTAAIVESKDSNDAVVVSESRKKLNHDTNKEQEISDLDGKSIIENVIHVRPSSHRIRRTLQNNIHNMTQQLKKNNASKGITKEVTIATSSCPRNLSPTNITVSLLIQSSIDRLWILQETCQRWKAPIIVVVAVSDDHTTTASDNNSTIVLQNHIVQWKQTCAQLQVIVYHLDSTTESTPESYPVNTLRNVALDAVSTSHILMMDIDFIPSQRLDSMIQSALIEQQQQQQHAATAAVTTTNKNEDTEKVAMVIPAFDRVLHPPCTSSDECAQHLRSHSNFIPFNFHELQQCYNNDECIIFQSMDNWEGHSSTRTELWLQQKWYADDSNDGTDPTTKSIRTIPCFDSLRYEPYVVVRWCPSSSLTNELSQSAKTSNIHPVAPYYDERFHGYGKNKIQLISHLRLMGYKFTVLPNAGFIVHNPHVESSAKTVWNNIQEHQLHRTMDVLYQTFLNELVSIYLTGVKNGGTAPNNIVSACTTGHTSKQ